MTPIVISGHRFRKLLAGAYRWRDVTIEIYTKARPDQRRKDMRTDRLPLAEESRGVISSEDRVASMADLSP